MRQRASLAAMHVEPTQRAGLEGVRLLCSDLTVEARMYPTCVLGVIEAGEGRTVVRGKGGRTIVKGEGSRVLCTDAPKARA